MNELVAPAGASDLDVTDLRRQLATSLERIGDFLIELDRTKDGLRAYDASLKLFESDRGRAGSSDDFAAVNRKLARVHSALGDLKSAVRHSARATEASMQLARENPSRADLQLEALRSRLVFAHLLIRNGQTAAALQQLSETVHTCGSSARPGIEWDRVRYGAVRFLGRLRNEPSHPDRGLAQLREARSIAWRIAATAGKGSGYDLQLVSVAAEEADVLIELGDPAGALALSDAIVDDIRSLAERKVASKAALAQALGNLTWYATIANQSARALQAADEAIEIADDDHPIQIKRGHALLAMGSRRAAMEQYKRIAPNQRRDGKKWSDAIVQDLMLLKSRGVAIETLSEDERGDIAKAELEAIDGS
jgi:tetratricopeptide (TPR) repeat protein